ncbi:MAG: exo-alpha-sialidase [Clostridia bacterium]|nr:exo-alpha-sialidase [Clostridia bacterium]
MKDIPYTMYREYLAEGFDGEKCRISPRPFRTPDGRIHISYSMLLLHGSDVFTDRFVISSSDGGKTFSGPLPFQGMPQTFEKGIRSIYSLNVFYHNKTNSNFAIGRVTRYADDSGPVLSGRNCMRALTGTFDPAGMRFTSCEIMIPPGTEELDNLTFMEPLEEEDGTVLIPAYARPGGRRQHEVIVFRFSVENGRLRFLERSRSICRPDLSRGLCEPRLAKLYGKYYLTIRSDESSWLAFSDNGMEFSEPEEWHFEDGEILGSRNTQQAWLTRPDGLFLVYTRETPHNRHIFRNRAPLFIARFDEERNRVIRDSEEIAVPEMGARLGNFTVTGMKPDEAWICVCEWMQTTPPDCSDSSVCVRYGANNRLWRTRIVF